MTDRSREENRLNALLEQMKKNSELAFSNNVAKMKQNATPNSATNTTGHLQVVRNGNEATQASSPFFLLPQLSGSSLPPDLQNQLSNLLAYQLPKSGGSFNAGHPSGMAVQNLNFIQINAAPQPSSREPAQNSQVFTTTNSQAPLPQINEKLASTEHEAKKGKRKRLDNLKAVQESLRLQALEKENPVESVEKTFVDSTFNLVLNCAEIKLPQQIKFTKRMKEQFLSIMASIQFNKPPEREGKLLKPKTAQLQFLASLVLNFLKNNAIVDDKGAGCRTSTSHENMAESLFIFVLLLERRIIVSFTPKCSDVTVDKTLLEKLLAEFGTMKKVFYQKVHSLNKSFIDVFKEIYSKVWLLLGSLIRKDDPIMLLVESFSRMSFKLLKQHYAKAVFSKNPLTKEIEIPSNIFLSKFKFVSGDMENTGFKNEILAPTTNTYVRLMLSLNLPVPNFLRTGTDENDPVILIDSDGSDNRIGYHRYNGKLQQSSEKTASSQYLREIQSSPFLPKDVAAAGVAPGRYIEAEEKVQNKLNQTWEYDRTQLDEHEISSVITFIIDTIEKIPVETLTMRTRYKKRELRESVVPMASQSSEKNMQLEIRCDNLLSQVKLLDSKLDEMLGAMKHIFP